MFAAAAPDLPENDLIRMYQVATSGDNPDEPDFKLIDSMLRKRGIVLKRKGGITVDTVKAQHIDDLKTLSTVSTLFGGSKKGARDADEPGTEGGVSSGGTGVDTSDGADAPTNGDDSPNLGKKPSWKKATAMKMIVGSFKTSRNIRELMAVGVEEDDEASSSA